MKLFPLTFAIFCLCSRLLALDEPGLAAVAAKFADPSGDVQYAARIELNKMIDSATAPGVNDRAAAIRAAEQVVADPDTPVEAKKYLLRAMARVASTEMIPTIAVIFRGPDAMLKEEARQVLESIRSPAATAILSDALRAAGDPREQRALLDSLALHRAPQAVPMIAALIKNPDPDLAGAAVAALGKIGGSAAVKALSQARADATLAAPLKVDVELAMLAAAKSDRNMVNDIYQKTGAPQVKVEAFLILSQGKSSATLIQEAMKSGDGPLRLAALKRGLESNVPDILQGGLDREANPFSANERLLVLANLPVIKPAGTAVDLAISMLKSESRDECLLAISGLGRLGGDRAFAALLETIANSDPTVSRAALQAIARIKAPGADAALLAAIRGPDGPAKLLAIKVAGFRALPAVRPLLLQIIQGSEKDPAQEAMKTIHAIGGIEELKSLCTAATAATDPQQRVRLAGLCKRFANQIGSDEAKALADAVKTE